MDGFGRCVGQERDEWFEEGGEWAGGLLVSSSSRKVVPLFLFDRVRRWGL